MQDKKSVIVRLSLLGVFIAAVVILMVTKGNAQEDTKQPEITENAEVGDSINSNEMKNEGSFSEAPLSEDNTKSDLPSFYTPDITALEISDTFNIEDYYITSRYSAANHFYIDENKTLWATGRNEYGQMGTGSFDSEEYYEEPIKVAENVILVDTSWNGYFTIYLTEAGELYGMGATYPGPLLGFADKGQGDNAIGYPNITEPILLMSDVAYARAGRECVVALKKDKTAYWWGQYAPWTHSRAGDIYNNYWKVVEDEKNPVKMLAIEPRKIMDNCKYITTGTFHGAAISEAGELYTWGCNIFGECGTPVIGDDFIRTPVKVLDDVKMVWAETMYFNDPLSSPPEIIRRDSDYIYNTFVLKRDDSIVAAGIGLGEQQKVTEVNGDLDSTEVHLYSDIFVPVQVIEYSEEANREVLKQLQFGMNKEEVETVLTKGGLTSHWMEYDDMAYFAVEDSRYYCYFDKNGKFEQLFLQEGGSRDERFVIGMDFSKLEELIINEGGTLEKVEENSDDATIWYIYLDEAQQIQYKFGIYEEKLSVLWENRYIN